MDKITKLPTSISLKEVIDDPNRFRRGWDLCLTHMICGQHEGENCVGICVYEDQTIENIKSSHEGLVEALRKIANLKVTPECFTDFQMSDKRRILAEEALKKAADGEGVK